MKISQMETQDCTDSDLTLLVWETATRCTATVVGTDESDKTATGTEEYRPVLCLEPVQLSPAYRKQMFLS